MEESWVSKTQKSTYAKKQIEDDAHLFFDQEGIVHRELVAPGLTINAVLYCDVIRLR